MKESTSVSRFADFVIVGVREYLRSHEVSLEEIIFGTDTCQMPSVSPAECTKFVSQYEPHDHLVAHDMVAEEFAARFIQTTNISVRRDVLAAVAFVSMAIKSLGLNQSMETAGRLFLWSFSRKVREYLGPKPVLDKATVDLIVNNVSIFQRSEGTQRYDLGMVDLVGVQGFIQMLKSMEKVCTLAMRSGPDFALNVIESSVALSGTFCVNLLADNKLVTKEEILGFVGPAVEFAFFAYDLPRSKKHAPRFSMGWVPYSLNSRHMELPQDLAVKLLVIYSLQRDKLRSILSMEDVISAASVRDFMAKHPKLSQSKRFQAAVDRRKDIAEIRAQKVSSLSRPARITAASTSTLSEVKDLVYDKVPEVRINLARRSDLTQGLQRILMKDADPSVVKALAVPRTYIGGSPYFVYPDVAEFLASHPASSVRMELAASVSERSITDKLVSLLASDASQAIQEVLLCNQSVPDHYFGEEITLTLLADPYMSLKFIHKVAERGTVTTQVYDRLAECAKISGIPMPGIRTKIASNPKTDSKILEQLYTESPDSSIAASVANNPNAPGEIRVLEGITS